MSQRNRDMFIFKQASQKHLTTSNLTFQVKPCRIFKQPLRKGQKIQTHEKEATKRDSTFWKNVSGMLCVTALLKFNFESHQLYHTSPTFSCVLMMHPYLNASAVTLLMLRSLF